MRTIDWDNEAKSIKLIDQTLLPNEYKIIECKTLNSICEAIKSLRVRGAPAIGAAGGFGIALAASLSRANTMESLIKDLNLAATAIKSARPTAINLSWAVERIMQVISKADSLDRIREIAILEAIEIANEDIEINKKIGSIGAKLLDDGDTILTHCNTGRLACVDWGTALGVVRSAIESGKEIKVIACETRPLNQGGRLTTWELMEDNIPVTLITDSMAGSVMRQGMVDKVLVGADRIVKDAIFNKIGTYTHAVLSNVHKIPFFVVAPISTIDFNGWESNVKIEMRHPDEIRFFKGVQLTPLKVPVYNPAFDATPMEYITGIITEKGVFNPPILLEKIRDF